MQSVIQEVLCPQSVVQEVLCPLSPNVMRRSEWPANALEFANVLRRWQPVHFVGVANEWPAREKWQDNAYFEQFSDVEVTTSATPNGRADAVDFDDQTFMLPLELKLSLRSLIRREFPFGDAVFYSQAQNGLLETEAPQLLADLRLDELRFASDALSAPPPLLNLWLGDSTSTTSAHADPFQNIYIVLRGAKHFRLFPPTIDAQRRRFETKRWARDDDTGQWYKAAVRDDEPSETEWFVGVDERREGGVTVTLEAGDALYLPQGWLHAVAQDDCTMAVNAWFDDDVYYLSPAYALQRLSDADCCRCHS